MKLSLLNILIIIYAATTQATDYSAHTSRTIQQAARDFNIMTGTTATVAAAALRFPNTRTMLPVILATTFGSAFINHQSSKKLK